MSDLDVSSPFAFDACSDTSDTPVFLDSNWDSFCAELSSVIDLPGRDINYVRDTLICASKLDHVISSVRSHLAAGRSTWAVVDAYHASLLATRLFAALYGVLSYGVRGRTVLVDFRPGLGSPDDHRSFRQTSKGIAHPVRVLMPKSKFLEQKDAWALVIRLCNQARDSDDWKEALAVVKNHAADKVSKFRNGVLYDSVLWEWLDDFEATPGDLSTIRRRIADQSGEHTLTMDTLVAMVNFCNRALTELAAQIGYDISTFSMHSDEDVDAPTLLC